MKYTLIVALLGLVVSNAQTSIRGTKAQDEKVENEIKVDVDNKDDASEIFLPQGTKVRITKLFKQCQSLYHLFLNIVLPSLLFLAVTTTAL